MRGKNMMEPFFDKLNDHERWQVIQYIRSLQAASKGLVYNEVENSFNKTDKPLGKSDNESAKGQPAAE